jgi:hypothetical protein
MISLSLQRFCNMDTLLLEFQLQNSMSQYRSKLLYSLNVFSTFNTILILTKMITIAQRKYFGNFMEPQHKWQMKKSNEQQFLRLKMKL